MPEWSNGIRSRRIGSVPAQVRTKLSFEKKPSGKKQKKVFRNPCFPHKAFFSKKALMEKRN